VRAITLTRDALRPPFPTPGSMSRALLLAGALWQRTRTLPNPFSPPRTSLVLWLPQLKGVFAMKRRIAVLLLVVLLVGVIPARAQGPAVNLTEGCVDHYAPGVDYFPAKVSVDYAGNFTVEYHDHYKTVTITTPYAGGDAVQYVVVQCGTPAPADVGNATVIEAPAGRLITLSTSYLPFVEALGLLDQLVGHDKFAYVSNPAVRARIDAGQLVEVGEGAAVNVERVLELEPSLILASSSGMVDFDAHPVLQQAGLPVVLTGEHMEPTPLGRAEWVKFVALFYNREAQANEVFDRVAAEYQALVALAAGVKERPRVFLDSPWQGTWYMAGGQSFTARLLADAGAAYVYADDASTGSLTLDFESVLDRAGDADFWVNANGFWLSLDDALAADERFAEFQAFQDGNVWTNNLRLNEFGGNDYYETGPAYPQLILADLIAIFHPDLLPEHEFTFYRHLE